MQVYCFIVLLHEIANLLGENRRVNLLVISI
jgi:hypothetical protein